MKITHSSDTKDEDFLGVSSTKDTISPSILSISHHLTLEKERAQEDLVPQQCHICGDEEGTSENSNADQNQSSEVAKEVEGKQDYQFRTQLRHPE